MATDRRELVLARLLVVSEGVEGVVTAQRNKRLLVDAKRPAIVFFDADEDAMEEDGGGAKPGNAPNLVTMTPEIFLMLGTVPENVGSEINAFRLLFLKAVLFDADLKTIMGSNGRIKYNGCATGLSQGRNMEAEMGVMISFTYPFMPSEF